MTADQRRAVREAVGNDGFKILRTLEAALKEMGLALRIAFRHDSERPTCIALFAEPIGKISPNADRPEGPPDRHKSPATLRKQPA
jgi:hypothetical protein